ncbi:MAG: sigma-70 family RNA polymerase sigma factor [Ruminococcus sp.]|nr:sigma-70 family RNA polymerase sigma factor [Ruminococcus sp.]
MNDDELLTLLRSDPEKGLDAVVRLYSAYVYKIAFTRLRDVCSKEDIEEAVSDIFYKFFIAARDRSFELDKVRGLLSVIAGRHCIDVFRKNCKTPHTLCYDELDDIIAERDDLTADELTDAVKSLGEPDSTIIIRKYYFGQKNREIARELKMSEGTVGSKLSRGLRKLRAILGEETL